MSEIHRISKIQIDELFGLYNHQVSLHANERITIIHGPNGIGKTVLLRLVHAFVSGNYVYLYNIPFKLFQLTLDDGSIMGLRREAGNNSDLGQTLVFYKPLMGDELSVKAAVEPFAGPQWMMNIRRKLNVHLIETQRLLSIENNTPSISLTVKEYSQQIQTRIGDALTEYANIAQALDHSFPQRLLRGGQSSLDKPELKRRMLEIEHKRAELQSIGLLDNEQIPALDLVALDQMEFTQQNVMAFYAEDTAHKLGVFDDIAARLSLLLNNLNKKFKNKRLLVDQKNGLVVLDNNDNTLNLDCLSSGEQHELVLLYDLLFRVEPDTLVLIDEPELSLHVTWQKTFLSDLSNIVGMAHFDVLLATHSPFIAGEYNELMAPLVAG